MREKEYRAYLESRDLASNTCDQRIYALKRIENRYQVDLDKEYKHDGLENLRESLTYSTADAQAGVENPSRFDIEPDKLRTHLAWYKSHLNDYIKFCGGPTQPPPPGDEPVTNEQIEAVAQTFGLEKDLQSALRQHIDQLEEGLTIIDGSAEKKVEAGFIDILAQDCEGNPVVIELKAGPSKPEAVAQLLAYMGCIAEETGKPVRGILIAAEHHARVTQAARAVPNLALRSYAYRFEFK